MTTLRNAILTALKSLLRGRSLLQAILAFWFNPTAVEAAADRTAKVDGTARRSIKDFLKEADELLLQPIEPDELKTLSRRFKAQFRERLWNNPSCMLPSYNHQLPAGHEQGQYLSLDVGGSTLRVALVELRGRGLKGQESEIVRMRTFKITPEIKKLEGMAFFDWMAVRIHETVSESLQADHNEKAIPMGLAWSFPIEQTSLKGGLLQGMGKGFLAANGLLGQDLGEVIQFACRKQKLNVELAAIVNDSTAALLSQSYVSPTTRFGLILGTGVNIAVHLPTCTVHRSKFGTRPSGWFDKASHVIINTELGMFGHDILPLTRWDKLLKAAHPKPEFQPLEHLLSGYYLGEICRLALVEAIETTGIFGGVVPESLLSPYSLDTETLSIIEEDTSSTLDTALDTFRTRHPSTAAPTLLDMTALRTLASFISRRSAAIVAACVSGLWELKAEAEAEYLESLASASASASAETPPSSFAAAAETRAELDILHTVVAFNGSVIERYPGYLAACQRYVDELVVAAAGPNPEGAASIELIPAHESSLLGAAVALACLEEGKAN